MFNFILSKLYDLFLTVGWFWRIAIMYVFLFLPSWRWSQEWPKPVGGYYTINLHSYTQVHLLVLLTLLRANGNQRILKSKFHYIPQVQRVDSSCVYYLIGVDGIWLLLRTRWIGISTPRFFLPSDKFWSWGKSKRVRTKYSCLHESFIPKLASSSS